MKSLQAIVIVALGLVLFSSCARGYGCPYNSLNETETKTTPVDKVIPEEAITTTEISLATAC
ncbi:MAG: PBP1b-binding outer membrane lipoprotein LpoB [Polaribacter sp.]|jgi:hypothetical protein